MICFVGAGGKTSLGLALARELSESGTRVLLTTTTKMYLWQLEQAGQVVIEPNPQKLVEEASLLTESSNLMAAGAGVTAAGKVTGFTGQGLDDLFRSKLFDYILVEADGARGKAMKVPAQGEPVLPSLSTFIIPVVGIDILGSTLTADDIHRDELLTELAGQSHGSPVTTETIGVAIREYAHRAEVLKDYQLVIAINKADSAEDVRKATFLAQALLSDSITKVIVTSAINKYPVQEVLQWSQQ